MREYDWHLHYLEAVLETDQNAFQHKIQKAENVIHARYIQLPSDTESEEYQALQRTMEAVKVLKGERLAPDRISD